MRIIRNLWNFSIDSIDTFDLIIKTLMYLFVSSIFTVFTINLNSYIWINIFFYIITFLIDLYVFIGLIIMYLNFFKILK